MTGYLGTVPNEPSTDSRNPTGLTPNRRSERRFRLKARVRLPRLVQDRGSVPNQAPKLEMLVMHGTVKKLGCHADKCCLRTLVRRSRQSCLALLDTKE